MSDLFGLVLVGGRSIRMGTDKGSIIYPPSGQTQRLRCAELLARHCERVFISSREDQRDGIEPGLSVITDAVVGEGPGVGILSAHAMHPERPWLVLACDFPFSDSEDVAYLVGARSREHAATCYVHERAEPLFSIWELEALRALKRDFQKFDQSPSRILRSLNCKWVRPLREQSLMNVNRQSGLIGSV